MEKELDPVYQTYTEIRSAIMRLGNIIGIYEARLMEIDRDWMIENGYARM